MPVKHTEGPWTFAEGVSNVGREDIAIGSVDGGEHQLHIADVWKDGANSPAEAEANARLIAAAPELLAASKEAIIRITDLFNRHERHTYRTHAEADRDLELVLASLKLAIVKAEGAQ